MIGGPEIGVVAIVCATMISIVVPGLRILARRSPRDSEPARIPAEVSERLQRIEQAVDSIAVEVERISEGQRFTTKLLADRAGENSSSRGIGGAS
ncbi:MAG: hypothetical protein M3081_03250 [Gemmatimonadota bacterium]|nr:hypothetical protein [Gemmatimonadota bacterium]